MSDTLDDQINLRDVIEPYSDKPDEETADEYAGGSTPDRLSLPDESPRIQLVSEMQELVRQEIERERRVYSDANKAAMKVDTNVSQEVQFLTLTVGAQAVQICREMENRGRVVITNYSGQTVSIGTQPGIMPGGADTVGVAVGPAYAREIRTRRALWAIATADSVIDVQLEFS